MHFFCITLIMFLFGCAGLDRQSADQSDSSSRSSSISKKQNQQSDSSKEFELAKEKKEAIDILGRCLKNVYQEGFPISFNFKEASDFSQDLIASESEKKMCLEFSRQGAGSDRLLMSLLEQSLSLSLSDRGYRLQSNSLRCPTPFVSTSKSTCDPTIMPTLKRAIDGYQQRVRVAFAERRSAQELAQRKIKAEQDERNALERQSEIQKARIEQAENRKKIIAQKEVCFGKTGVGVCLDWSENNREFFCSNVGFTGGLSDRFNPDCYIVDKLSIHVKLEARNNLNKIVKDITIKCNQLGNSGTIIKSDSKIFFDTWEPSQIKKISYKIFKHEQISRLSCEVTGWK